jgi:protein-L-isoaspartate(D-aspartate) O-methyltransferase
LEGYFENERTRMVESLEAAGLLKNDRIKEALLRVPREKFIPAAVRKYAYAATRLPISGLTQAISSPRTVVVVTEALNPLPGDKVLEIGTGSGYHAAVISEIVRHGGAPGHVYSIEIVPELVDMAKRNLNETGYSEGITVIQGDGFNGYTNAAPYHRIFSTAFAPGVPKRLVDQLRADGVLVMPSGAPLSTVKTVCIAKKLSDGTIRFEQTSPLPRWE